MEPQPPASPSSRSAEPPFERRRHRLDLSAFERLLRDPTLASDPEHLELLDGEIRDVPAVTPLRAAVRAAIAAMLRDRVPVATHRVAVGLPVRFPPDAMVRPDLAIARRDPSTNGARASAFDGDAVELAIEITDGALLRAALLTKAAFYARREVPELWVVDLVHGLVHLHVAPRLGDYQRVAPVHAGTLTPILVEEVEVPVTTLLGADPGPAVR